MLTSFLYIIVAILLLCVLIVVHELGHFIAGRMCGIGVVEFSVGFGPKLFGWRRKDTDYSIRAIPLGGFCKFVGEDKVARLPWSCGSTDMGDVGCVIRTIQPHIAGAGGVSHGDDYHIADKETACIVSAQAQLLLAVALLENDAAEARKVMSGPAPKYASKEDYFKVIDRFSAEHDLITYTPTSASIEY